MAIRILSRASTWRSFTAVSVTQPGSTADLLLDCFGFRFVGAPSLLGDLFLFFSPVLLAAASLCLFIHDWTSSEMRGALGLTMLVVRTTTPVVDGFALRCVSLLRWLRIGVQSCWTNYSLEFNNIALGVICRSYHRVVFVVWRHITLMCKSRLMLIQVLCLRGRPGVVLLRNFLETWVIGR